jgi:UDP-N-acetylglucosamine 2-epimerase (non-hydrolysing)
MLYQVMNQFDLKADEDLEVMAPNQGLHQLTSRILLGIQKALEKDRPDVVLVHGDTTTAMAAGTACLYSRIPVGHVEAGLRTYDLSAPFPEEFNRRVVALCSDMHFAPTEQAKLNLLREGINTDTIVVTGNTVIDALLWTIKHVQQDEKLYASVLEKINGALNFDWKNSRFVLITGHRRENFGKGFEEICAALSALAEAHPSVNYVYPVHLNPNVRGPVFDLLADHPNIHLVEPFGYQQFAILLKHAHIILTDSGGIQEEAPSLGKPVLVMRDVTERPEAVTAGTVKLVSSNKEKIFTKLSELLTDHALYEKMSTAHNPYGDGQAARRIVATLSEKYKRD